MKVLKKAMIAVGVLIVVVMIGMVALFIKMNQATSTYDNFDFSSLDLSKVSDGTFIGSEDGGLVKASVEVTVKDHKITKVKILSHDCGKGKPAEKIVDDIAAKNSLEVDAVSGATFSSNVIKVAVYHALMQ